MTSFNDHPQFEFDKCFHFVLITFAKCEILEQQQQQQQQQQQVHLTKYGLRVDYLYHISVQSVVVIDVVDVVVVVVDCISKTASSNFLFSIGSFGSEKFTSEFKTSF